MARVAVSSIIMYTLHAGGTIYMTTDSSPPGVQFLAQQSSILAIVLDHLEGGTPPLQLPAAYDDRDVTM